MGIIGTILIGFIVGLVARAIKPGNDSAGFIVTTLIGIVGSFIATYLGQAMGWYTVGQPAGFIASVIGAILLLFVWGMVAGRRR
ncbi:GlsB/YeaQ/YmgE family stress response membrane protein [Pseudacidovorax sp. NFM-22]|uniref:GlsB/YeaQ/YmgE family stress response membrane protein n=1 Tax=Pseudacidovorax sp. NFM-22 TaxID=2744469 RepID=UPI001F195B3E|nr:GlsB/YeaQ/YmgE family stress response membrane protein [Pseudacidovorax sp. NFM-22]